MAAVLVRLSLVVGLGLEDELPAEVVVEAEPSAEVDELGELLAFVVVLEDLGAEPDDELEELPEEPEELLPELEPLLDPLVTGVVVTGAVRMIITELLVALSPATLVATAVNLLTATASGTVAVKLWLRPNVAVTPLTVTELNPDTPATAEPLIL
jgi:hypothetical protein